MEKYKDRSILGRKSSVLYRYILSDLYKIKKHKKKKKIVYFKRQTINRRKWCEAHSKITKKKTVFQK